MARPRRRTLLGLVLGAALLCQCQWVGGFDEFHPPGPPCSALPRAKKDPYGLALMSRVDIPDASCFWVDQTEVTVEQYQSWQSEIAADAVSWDPTWCAWKGERSDPIFNENDACAAEIFASDLQPFAPNKPMRCVDFCEAEAFCRWAGKHLCYSTDAFGVQGPRGTVREWLLACSNSLTTAYPWGNDADAQRCTTDQSEGNCITSRAVCGPLAGGEKATCATASGIYDMLGNVNEWVFSCNLVTPDQGKSPTGCLVRGGGYDEPLQACVQEKTLRNDQRHPSLGFRCCADLTTDEQLLVSNVTRP